MIPNRFGVGRRIHVLLLVIAITCPAWAQTLPISIVPQVAAGSCYSAGLRSDGTVVSVPSGLPALNVEGWVGIIQIAAGYGHIVGLKSNGTVIASSNNIGEGNVQSWANIIQVAAGDNYTVGLKSDGTVVATGDNSLGQCNVSGWVGIKKISCSFRVTFGLKLDGTVVAAGSPQFNIQGLSGITDICAVSNYAAALKTDGTVLFISYDGYVYPVGGLENIIQLTAAQGGYTFVGLRSDRTVAVFNFDPFGFGGASASWTDIVQISAGPFHILGLKADGTVLSGGLCTFGEDIGWCNVGGWQLKANNIEKLKEDIDRQQRRLIQFTYPTYMLDWSSFADAVSVVWMDFTDWINKSNLTAEYDAFYWSGINYDRFAYQALRHAKSFYTLGDYENSKKYIQCSEEYTAQSLRSFRSAELVFENRLIEAEVLAQQIYAYNYAAREIALFVGKVTNPVVANAFEYIFIGLDFATNYALSGPDVAEKTAARDLMIQVLFTDTNFPELGGTISDYVKTAAIKDLIPNIGKAFESSIVFNMLASELASWYSERVIKDICNAISEPTRIYDNYTSAKIHSPGELSIYNSSGQIIGLVDGSVKHQIAHSFYDNDQITIFYPENIQSYVVVGKENGTYGLDITSLIDGVRNTFDAANIPITLGAAHRFVIDWETLKQGGEGVTFNIDSNADGVDELTIKAGRQYAPIPARIDLKPETLNLSQNGTWITAYIQLPQEYDPTSILPVSIELRQGTEFTARLSPKFASVIGDYNHDGIMDLTIKFDAEPIRAFLEAAVLSSNAVQFEISGYLADNIFFGHDSIRIRRKL